MTLEQFLFDFYLRLRRRGLLLTIGEYKIMLEALQAGLGIKSKNDFLEICQLLWCKSLQHNILVFEEFHTYYQHVFGKIIEISNKHDIEDSTTKRDSAHSAPNTPAKIKRSSDEETKKKTGDIPSENSTSAQNTEQAEQGRKNLTLHNAPIIAYYPASQNENAQGVVLNTGLYSSDIDYIHSPFILTEAYLPMSLRQMQQSWRKLRHFESSIENFQNIDWRQTIENTAQRGFFHKPTYIRMRKNQFQLVILIDHHGSMIPHWTIGQQLIEAAKTEGGYPDATVYYTHNIPSKYLYGNSYQTDSTSVEDMLQKCDPRHTVFLFFSDAGASRGLFNAQRVLETKRFVDLLGKRVHSMAWLNPMPKARWENTSAELIKHLVPMFECTEDGIDTAIKKLKIGRDGRI